MSYVADHLAW